MLKKLFLFLLSMQLLMAQNPSTILSQRGGKHNAIFLNPAKLSSNSNDIKLHANIVSISTLLSQDSYDFVKALNTATSSNNKNQEISELLKSNIGKSLSYALHNFSSIHQTNKNFSWSIGLAHTFNGSFITHSGFGSKGAMESSMKNHRILISTLALKEENLHYGINLKSIKKSQKNHNYSIREMINNDSLKDYFSTNNTQEEKAIALDAGLIYELQDKLFNSKLNLSVIDIGDTSFTNMTSLPSTINIGTTLETYKHTLLELSYLDLFKHQKNQTFEDRLRIHLSKDFFSKELHLSTGLLYGSLLYGATYQYSLFNIGIHSYKTKNYSGDKEDIYELSLALKW